MAKKRTKRQRAIIRRRIFIGCVAVFLVAAIAAITLAVTAIYKAISGDGDGGSSQIPSSQAESKKDETPTVKSTATVLSTGDIMVHSTQLDGAHTSDGGYDFSAFFKGISDYTKKSDLAIANLEVTFGGDEGREYSGYPGFNTPDVLADNLKSAGFDVLLTANNHCYDTGASGFTRTMQILDERGFDYTGTRRSDSDPTYIVKKVNGIKIGMIAYTYETARAADGRKTMNGIAVSNENAGLINSFSYDSLDAFYTTAERAMADMKRAGAEFVVFYMHWGEEYQLSENTWQKTIAQKLCNMGVNIIIGSHPHVVQPISLLHSEDSENTTVCLYSTGNAVSNQRQELMDSCPSGHTEDGMLFSYTLNKMSDGTVELSAIDLIPTWVDKYRGGSGYQYTIYPAAEKRPASFERTKAIVASGLTECQKAIGCELTFPDETAE